MVFTIPLDKGHRSDIAEEAFHWFLLHLRQVWILGFLKNCGTKEDLESKVTPLISNIILT
jgi:hypothetical protein